MGDVNVLSTEDRVAIDRVYERLSGRTHYEVLAIAQDSSWDSVAQAARDLRKRMDTTRFVGVPSEEYQRRIDAVLRAVDQATDVLGDPVRRFLYDQQIRRGEGRRGETPSPARPAVTPLPPKPLAPIAREERSSRTSDLAPPGDAPLVVPAPLRKDPATSPGAGRPPMSRTPDRRPSVVPPPLDVVPKAAPLSTDRRDLDALLVEVERIAVSVQFCIAQILDPQASRMGALQTAGQALADTRATLAAVQARRDEEVGRWTEAAANWQRAARANPHDVALLARLADCYQRAGDAASAEATARRALAIDPTNEEARAVLGALGRR
ncbi:MAG: tetratricopeptide repeat protein [Myxococcaceae bacterium]|nr:tetratricopeptide repeat protein [Myxococcaceae bacterium]